MAHAGAERRRPGRVDRRRAPVTQPAAGAPPPPPPPLPISAGQGNSSRRNAAQSGRGGAGAGGCGGNYVGGSAVDGEGGRSSGSGSGSSIEGGGYRRPRSRGEEGGGRLFAPSGGRHGRYRHHSPPGRGGGGVRGRGGDYLQGSTATEEGEYGGSGGSLSGSRPSWRHAKPLPSTSSSASSLVKNSFSRGNVAAAAVAAAGRRDTGDSYGQGGGGGGGGGCGGAGGRGGDMLPGHHHRRGGSPSKSVRLAERLGELEAKLASGGGGVRGGGNGGQGPHSRRDVVGDALGREGCFSTAENEVQSAALRHALLLEERGLQLDRAEALLRRKEEEEGLMKSELLRLGEASIKDREAWRRLAKAEGAISRLLDRSNKLETLARVAKDSLDEERRLRREEQKRHASELQRATGEAAAAAEAASKEGAAARSSRDLCDQMNGVCRKMRRAAEEAGERCDAAEESERAVRLELTLAEAAVKNSEEETEALRERLEDAEERARHAAEALEDEKEATSTLRGFLRNREARLEQAEENLAASTRTVERSEEVSNGLRGALERSQREAEQLRSRLETSGDLAADEAGRAKEALQAEKATRSELASALERESTLREQYAALKAETEELRLKLTGLSKELSESTKLCQDRLVDSEVASRTAAEAERRARSLERRSVEAARAASAADRSLAGFQGSVAGALRAVEDALADALRGVGVRAAGDKQVGEDEERGVENSWRNFPSDIIEGSSESGGEEEGFLVGGVPRGIGDGGAARSRSRDREGRGLRRGRERPSPSPRRGDSLFAGTPAAAGAAGAAGASASAGAWAGSADIAGARTAGTRRVGSCGEGCDGWLGPAAATAAGTDDGSGGAASAVVMGRLERALSRIMRRIDGARGLREWVEIEVETARNAATEGLRELGGRWEAELGRLQQAERKLVRLQEQAKYGGRRAALDAREECYAKIEKVEKQKWTLRDALVSEEREVEVLRAHLRRLKDGAEKAAVAAENEYRSVREELEGERTLRQRLQDKVELAEGKAGLAEEKLSALEERHEREELQQRQEKEGLLAQREALQSQLAQQLERGREKEKEAALQVSEVSDTLRRERAAWDEEARRLTRLLEHERRARLAESAMGEAVLREVRETQGLLGEVSTLSPSSDSNRSGTGRKTFRRSSPEQRRRWRGRPASVGRKIQEGGSSALELQASALERLVADAAELIKHTGRFYDRYAETHKASPAGGAGLRNGSGKSLGTFGGGYCPNCRAAGTSSATAAEGHPRAELFATALSPRGRQQERSRTFLDRTIGQGTGEGAAAAAGREVDLKELDQRCYSLLESNARLCLRLQGLGLEYAGLARELIAAEGPRQSYGRRRGEPLDVAELDGSDGNDVISGDSDHRRRQRCRHQHQVGSHTREHSRRQRRRPRHGRGGDHDDCDNRHCRSKDRDKSPRNHRRGSTAPSRRAEPLYEFSESEGDGRGGGKQSPPPGLSSDRSLGRTTRSPVSARCVSPSQGRRHREEVAVRNDGHRRHLIDGHNGRGEDERPPVRRCHGPNASR